MEELTCCDVALFMTGQPTNFGDVRVETSAQLGIERTANFQ